MMRRMIILLAVILALCAAAACAPAEGSPAYYDPIKVAMELSTNRFTGPREITVTIRVSNVGEYDMPGPVKLFDPNGRQVSGFGEPELCAGQSQTWSGKWNVTQRQLDNGKLRFTLQYTVVDGDGQLAQKTLHFSKTLIRVDSVPQVTVSRVISHTMASDGETVTVTYKIANNGLVDIHNIRITENKSISGDSVSIAEIRAGETNSWTFSVLMGTRDLTSAGVICYEVDGVTYTDEKESVTVAYHHVGLTVDLKADKKGDMVGESVTLFLTLTNEDQRPYRGITVTDPILGTIVSGLTLEAGESRTFEKTVAVEKTADYQYIVSGEDADGVPVAVLTRKITVAALAPSEMVDLSVTATADPNGWRLFPGSVVFTVNVTNRSAVKVERVSVYVLGSGYLIYTFPDIEPGETRSFTREIYCSMNGTYQFQARAQDRLGEVLRFDSNRIHVYVSDIR